MTSAFRWTSRHAAQHLAAILRDGPWHLPRPAQQRWAVDATPTSIAAVDWRHNIVFKAAIPPTSIYRAELLAAAVALAAIPPHYVLLTDNMAVKGAFRRSSQPSAVLLFASWLRRRKDITIDYIPSRFNPADGPSRSAHHAEWAPGVWQALQLSLRNYPINFKFEG